MAGIPLGLLLSAIGLRHAGGRRQAIAGLVISGAAAFLFFGLPLLISLFSEFLSQIGKR